MKSLKKKGRDWELLHGTERVNLLNLGVHSSVHLGVHLNQGREQAVKRSFKEQSEIGRANVRIQRLEQIFKDHCEGQQLEESEPRGVGNGGWA